MVPSYIGNVEEWLKGFHYFDKVKVRFSETDLFGHVNNTVVFIYFEQVRTNFMMEYNLMEQEVEPGVIGIPVMANLHCDYLQQAYFNDELEVGCKIARVGRSSIDMHYVVLRNGEICFTGMSTVVQMNKETGKSLAFSEKQLQSIELPVN